MYSKGDLEGMDLEEVARLIALPAMKRAQRSVEVVARRMGLAASTLYNLLDRDVPSMPLTLNRAVQLVNATGDYLLMHAMAFQVGGTFIPPSASRPARRESVAQAMARVTGEHGDVIRKFAAALDPASDSGGVASREEVVGFDREVAELIDALSGLRETLIAEGSLEELTVDGGQLTAREVPFEKF